MDALAKFCWRGGLAALLLLLGCNNPTAPAPTEGRIKISVKSIAPAPSRTLRKGTTAVAITKASIVIAEIEFENSVKDSIDFELEEPFVSDLAVDTSLHEIATVEVPFGSYEEMEIQIDELEAGDSTAFKQNPQLQNLSIRVEGFVDDNPAETFVFTSDLSAEQEREFEPPLVIDASSPATNVVLAIDMGMWFVDQEGNFLDPRRHENQRLIEKNIKSSFKVYEDDDGDGDRDGGDD